MLIYKEKKYTHKDEENEMKQKENSNYLLHGGSHQKDCTLTPVRGSGGRWRTYSQVCAMPVLWD